MNRDDYQRVPAEAFPTARRGPGRLDPIAALFAALAVTLFLAVAVDSHTPQPYVPAGTFAPFPTSWSDVDPLPPHSSGPVEVAPRPGTPVHSTVGQGRWHTISTRYYGGSDGLDDGTHHFADGGVFRKGTWAIASGRGQFPLGTVLELRWRDPKGVWHHVTATVRDRHGKSVRPFLDLSVALAAALFGRPENHVIEYRVVP